MKEAISKLMKPKHDKVSPWIITDAFAETVFFLAELAVLNTTLSMMKLAVHCLNKQTKWMRLFFSSEHSGNGLRIFCKPSENFLSWTSTPFWRKPPFAFTKMIVLCTRHLFHSVWSSESQISIRLRVHNSLELPVALTEKFLDSCWV